MYPFISYPRVLHSSQYLRTPLFISNPWGTLFSYRTREYPFHFVLLCTLVPFVLESTPFISLPVVHPFVFVFTPVYPFMDNGVYVNIKTLRVGSKLGATNHRSVGVFFTPVYPLMDNGVYGNIMTLRVGSKLELRFIHRQRRRGTGADEHTSSSPARAFASRHR